MANFSRWLLMLALGTALLLVGCDEVTTQTPSPVAGQNESLVQVPTRTLGPIVSYTPRFTATPIPSITFTPSITPSPTVTLVPPTTTPTPQPTPTPTVAGVIRSPENVNLREGPGTDYEIAVSAAPGTELGVVGLQIDEQGREWFKVAYTGEDGEVALLWVSASLVETEYREVIRPAATTATEADTTAAPPGTPEPGRTPAPPSTLEPNRVEVLAYCRQKAVAPPEITSNDNVYIEWSWFVARPELMDEHLTNARYEVRLDGQVLENWSGFATETKREGGVWIVYWFYPVGKLSVGQHKVDFRLSWEEAISDGYKQFGPNTPNETDIGDCTFTVSAP